VLSRSKITALNALPAFTHSPLSARHSADLPAAAAQAFTHVPQSPDPAGVARTTRSEYASARSPHRTARERACTDVPEWHSAAVARRPPGIRGLTGWWGVVLEAPDPAVLADFYSNLLGWPMTSADTDTDTATLNRPGTDHYLAVQRAVDFVAPVWPPRAGAQGMQSHLDVEVDDLAAAVADAIALGARLADHQPPHDVRVLLDPAGHPFCLYLSSD